MIVVPAINSVSFEDAKEKISKAAEFARFIHLDVVDGRFAPNVTWGNPEELLRLKSYVLNLNIEIHLMVVEPEKVLEAWLKTGLVKRIIIHLEALNDASYIINRCREAGVEAMLAINPDTAVDKLLPHLNQFRAFQVLGVKPGLAGQSFRSEVIDKIKFLRELAPDATIEVDGGVNQEVARLAKKLGADILVSASYIFNSDDPRKAYEELSNA